MMGWRWIAALLPLLIACNDGVHFSEETRWENGRWAYADSVRFEVEFADTSKAWDLTLLIDHAPDFAYQNLYARIRTTFPDETDTEQVLSLQLSDKTGLWLGKCSGQLCRARIPLNEGVRMPQPGHYSFEFVQHSREDSLQGIYAVGLDVRPYSGASFSREK
jgi:gliding motility-associated lipoprotein GldH